MQKIGIHHRFFLHIVPFLILGTAPTLFAFMGLPGPLLVPLSVLLAGYVFREMKYAFVPSYRMVRADSGTYLLRHRLPYLVILGTLLMDGAFTAMLLLQSLGNPTPIGSGAVGLVYGLLAAYAASLFFQHSFAPLLRKAGNRRRM